MKSSSSELLAQARQRHQAGDLTAAEQLYRQILHTDPYHLDAWHNLGGLYLARGRAADAADCFSRVLLFSPRHAAAHSDLGIAFAQQGRMSEAEESFRKAIDCRPNDADACTNLGVVLGNQGRYEEALATYRQALQFNPDSAVIHNNMGQVLNQLGRLAEAEASCRQALRLRPSYPEALTNLGAALARQGRLPEAIPLLQQALQIRPEYATARINLEKALAEQSQGDEAKADKLRGDVLHQQRSLPEAIEAYQRALQRRPDDYEALHNMGCVLEEQRRLDEAEACYEQALRLKPDLSQIHINLSAISLLRGNFTRGWAEYEWRRGIPGFTGHTYAQPMWDGSLLHGRAILLHPEQGLGDAIQFIRYAPLVKQRGGRVIVGCSKTLRPVFATCPGIDFLTDGSDMPPFDVHAALLSLPGIFQTTPQTIPAHIPYLFAEPERVQRWRNEFAGVKEYKIGIAWQGNPRHVRDQQRSAHLRHFEPLARVNGVRLISLQVGAQAGQVGEVAGRFSVMDLGDKLDVSSLADVAAVMMNLDLVVTVDTALAHLAGALGVPVWVALPYYPDWRWMLDRDDSPWYPSARLFRQTEYGAWGSVFERMASAIHPPG